MGSPAKTAGPLGELLSPPGARAGSSSTSHLPRQLQTEAPRAAPPRLAALQLSQEQDLDLSTSQPMLFPWTALKARAWPKELCATETEEDARKELLRQSSSQEDWHGK